MFLGCCALSGIPFTSGFFSKDEIIAQTWSHSILLGGVLLFTAFLTSYYTFRLYFQVFQGPLVQPDAPADQGPATASPDQHVAVDAAAAHDDHHHNHEPWIMLGPLVALAIGAICIGWIFVRSSEVASFLGHSPSFKLAYDMASLRFDNAGGPPVNPAMFGQPDAAAHTEGEPLIPWSMLQGAAVSLAGLGLAYLLHLKERDRAEKLASSLQPLTGILEAKYWVDELYDAMIVEPLRHIAKVFFVIDRAVVDGVVWAISFVPQLSGFALKLTTQRGYLQGYAATMFFGVLAILLLVFL